MTGLHFFGIGMGIFAIGLLKAGDGLVSGEPLSVGLGLVLMAVPISFIVARDGLPW